MSKKKRHASSIPDELIDSLLSNCDAKELLTEESKGVPRVAGQFPNEASLLRLVTAVIS